MSLQQIYDAIMTRVAADVPGLQHALGADELDAHGAPPRVVWVPSTDQYDGDPKRGARTQPAIYEVSEGFDVHIHGANYDDARDLRDMFLRALHRETMGSSTPESGEWVPGNAGVVRDGRVYVLSIRVQTPVTQQTQALQTATPAGVTETQTVQT
jgi:hypothetical protein